MDPHDGQDSALIEILGRGPLPITHLETRDYQGEIGLDDREVCEGKSALIRPVSFAATLLSKLVYVARLFRASHFH
jgi:hypothetical protein